ncbi:cytotoxin [Planococcus salinus]|uniref:Cytotoxin n=1 Tax=Planococcus salinus TaxID=1848460 RepID=A0A3M8P534_9BACL|nr:cytotoxin [Planococcus salinus]RNF38777.1 cytotoxin [Planococcus salinus]
MYLLWITQIVFNTGSNFTRFKCAYKKLSPAHQAAVDSAITTLANGKPYSDGLRVKKMQGTGKKSIMKASPTMDVRITFEFDNPDQIIFRNVGDHDITLNNP